MIAALRIVRAIALLLAAFQLVGLVSLHSWVQVGHTPAAARGFDVSGARAAGYSDNEIAAHLAKQGYSSSDVAALVPNATFNPQRPWEVNWQRVEAIPAPGAETSGFPTMFIVLKVLFLIIFVALAEGLRWLANRLRTKRSLPLLKPLTL